MTIRLLVFCYLMVVSGCDNGDTYNPTFGPSLLGPGARKGLEDVNFLTTEEKQRFLIGSSISIDKLSRLSDSTVREIRHLVASNQNVSEELLIKLSRDSVIGIRQAVANSNRASEKVLAGLIQDESPLVRIAAITNSNWAPSSLHEMFIRGIEPIYLAKNPSISRETLITIIDKNDIFSSAGAASNHKITPDLGYRLLELDSTVVNIELCKNASSGKKVIRALVKNMNERVRVCAEKTLTKIDRER